MSTTVCPSVRLSPSHRSSKGVHFFKLNIYFHIGYAASIITILNSSANDVGTDASYRKKMSGTSFDFGHGLYTSFGINLSWKAIGAGFEQRNGKLDCFSLNKEIYGSEHYDLSMALPRVYLNFRPRFK